MAYSAAKLELKVLLDIVKLVLRSELNNRSKQSRRGIRQNNVNNRKVFVLHNNNSSNHHYHHHFYYKLFSTLLKRFLHSGRNNIAGQHPLNVSFRSALRAIFKTLGRVSRGSLTTAERLVLPRSPLFATAMIRKSGSCREQSTRGPMFVPLSGPVPDFTTITAVNRTGHRYAAANTSRTSSTIPVAAKPDTFMNQNKSFQQLPPQEHRHQQHLILRQHVYHRHHSQQPEHQFLNDGRQQFWQQQQADSSTVDEHPVETLSTPALEENVATTILMRVPSLPAADNSSRKNTNSSPTSSRSTHRLPRHKRPAHIDAEYRRRGKIQKGFEMLCSLVPELQELPSSGRKSKAFTLSKSAEHIRTATSEIEVQKSEIDKLKEEIHLLQNDLERCQKQLPSSGVQSLEKSTFHKERWLRNYLHSAMAVDWKFWIFSFIMQPLCDSYTRTVTLANPEEFLHSICEWSDNHLTLVNLRPIVLSLLRDVSVSTSIITHPDRLREEVLEKMKTDVK